LQVPRLRGSESLWGAQKEIKNHIRNQTNDHRTFVRKFDGHFNDSPNLYAIEQGSHPFPSRTRKLRLASPMVLGPSGPGRVGRVQFWTVMQMKAPKNIQWMFVGPFLCPQPRPISRGPVKTSGGVSVEWGEYRQLCGLANHV